MIDIETLRSSLKQWKKEKILKICEEYSIPVNDELIQKTKKEIEHMIVEKAKQLNEQESRHKDDMERTRLIMDGVEATLVSLHNDGHNGPVTKSLEAINEYKSQKAVE